jgi:hypothetical protein
MLRGVKMQRAMIKSDLEKVISCYETVFEEISIQVRGLDNFYKANFAGDNEYLEGLFLELRGITDYFRDKKEIAYGIKRGLYAAEKMERFRQAATGKFNNVVSQQVIDFEKIMEREVPQ